MNKGKIVQIIGPVVDVEFTGELPAIYSALTLEFDVPGQGHAKRTLEVEQHLGDNWVRCVCMGSPTTLNTRPMTQSPTGMEIGPPVSATS